MKIAVCIKQVPASNELEMHEKTGVLIREDNNTKINPYDLSAIEAALQMKESYNCTVTSYTMGPKSAKEAILYSFSMGVDEGVHLNDPKFAGADVYATSYTLAQGISLVNDYDLIICGKQTTDGDTGQVGPALAEHLNIPHIYCVTSIDKVKENHIYLTQKLGKKSIQLIVSTPCVLIIDQEAFSPRLPSLKLKLKSKKKEVKVLGFKDMRDKKFTKYGLDGSPTQVKRIFLPKKKYHESILTGDSNQLSNKILDICKKHKVI